MGKMIRAFCWHQHLSPLGLSAPVLGLYTCIKALNYIPGPGVRWAFTGPLVLWFNLNRTSAAGSGRQERVERYCCNVICGAPTTSNVKMRWEARARFAPAIYYWPFQGGASFVVFITCIIVNFYWEIIVVPLAFRWYLIPPFMIVCVAGRGSLIGSVFAWYASGPEFDPHVRHILSCRLGHENILTAILPLPLIQDEQLSVSGAECALSTGKLPRRLAQEQCG